MRVRHSIGLILLIEKRFWCIEFVHLNLFQRYLWRSFVRTIHFNWGIVKRIEGVWLVLLIWRWNHPIFLYLSYREWQLNNNRESITALIDLLLLVQQSVWLCDIFRGECFLEACSLCFIENRTDGRRFIAETRWPELKRVAWVKCLQIRTLASLSSLACVAPEVYRATKFLNKHSTYSKAEADPIFVYVMLDLQ